MELKLKPCAIDLFCGAGGLSYGMQRAGVEILAGIDLDPACKYPFETNVTAKFCELDVATLTASFLANLFQDGSARVLAGCAPCQPFSSYTNNAASRRQEWHLLSKFGRLVTDLRPEIVTMENVPRLMKHNVFEDFVATLDRMGYHHWFKVVRCSDYGVPQTRRRLVLLASLLGEIQLVPPSRTDRESATVRNVIQHLDRIGAGDVSPTDPMHKSSGLSETNLERIRQSRPGGSWCDWDVRLLASCHTRSSGRSYQSVYGRMQWDEPAPTITTQFNGYGNGRFGHPSQDRAISLREGALLQTFPEDYSFVPEDVVPQFTPMARLIGNAVPVSLGEAVGKSIVGHLRGFS